MGSAQGFGQHILLAWDSVKDSDLAYYNIYRNTAIDSIGLIAAVVKTETTLVDSNILLGRTYFYRVTAVDSAGNESEFSNEMAVYTGFTNPVEMSHFMVSENSSGIRLNWKTWSETNNLGFEILRKHSSKNRFEKIGFVKGAGTSQSIRKYEFYDNDIREKVYYYRLKQINMDGTYKLSEIKKIRVNRPLKFELAQNYPNPFNSSTKIDYRISTETCVLITVFDILGKEVITLLNEKKSPEIGRAHV